MAGKDMIMAVPKRHTIEYNKFPPAVKLTVIESRPVGDSLLVVVDVSEGTIRTGMRLAVQGGEDEWEVRGLAFTPLASAEHDRSGLVLVPIGHHGSLPIGAQLAQI